MIKSDFENHGSYQYDNYGKTNINLKAGKGYSTDDKKTYKGKTGIAKGHPKGVKKGKCNQYTLNKPIQTRYGILPTKCDGTIIAVKITTNNKGFDTTSEEVCNKCGHVIQTAMQVIGKKPHYYKTIKFTSHEDWLKRNYNKMEGNPEDICSDAETAVHVTGSRLNTIDNHFYGSAGEEEVDNVTFGNFSTAPDFEIYNKKIAKELGLKAYGRFRGKSQCWNRGTEERMHLKKKCQENYVDICKTNFGLTTGQADEVKYVLERYPSFLKMPYDYEDIIFHISMYIILNKMGKKGTALMNTIRLGKLYNKQLYSIIKQKMNTETFYRK